MPKKACCCRPNCCNPIFFEEFITLFGNTMQTAVPVNPADLLVLRMNRPGNQSVPRLVKSRSHDGDQSCFYGGDCSN